MKVSIYVNVDKNVQVFVALTLYQNQTKKKFYDSKTYDENKEKENVEKNQV